MPGLDHTGPKGQGAKTGKKMGKCANVGAKNQPANTENGQGNTPANGRGLGRGLGKGQGGLGMGKGRKKQNGNENK
ncbi:DUF5320 domain-containing protein [bacterium]|jgi:hypothetical protein|nr:DUF5320 domain-containing protein [bacterium]